MCSSYKSTVNDTRKWTWFIFTLRKFRAFALNVSIITFIFANPTSTLNSYTNSWRSFMNLIWIGVFVAPWRAVLMIFFYRSKQPFTMHNCSSANGAAHWSVMPSQSTSHFGFGPHLEFNELKLNNFSSDDTMIRSLSTVSLKWTIYLEIEMFQLTQPDRIN